MYMNSQWFLSTINLIDENRWYNNGEHIACFTGEAATGFGAPSPISACAFLQNTGGTWGSIIKTLMQSFMDNHNCGLCGSIPYYFPQGDNNVANGMLTINYVGSTGGCDGLC
jgi:hypothetical protein